ncbi:MAG: hypothetical protein AABX63_02385 [Nanoarchaeota archaeon]
MILTLLAVVLIIAGCGKKAGEGTDFRCYRPYIQKGADCCLDRDDNKICDEDESPLIEAEKPTQQEDIPVKKTAEKGMLGQIQNRYGDTFNVYPSDQYDYAVSDVVFEGYNRSIRLEGKQCHFYSERKHKTLKETQPYWRPLPIACSANQDCIDFIKRNDNYLNNLLLDKRDVTCVQYMFGLE